MNLKNYRNDIISIGVTILLSAIIIIFSKSIGESGFLTDKYNKGTEYYEAQVTEVAKEELKADQYIEKVELGYQNVKIKMLEGPYKGKEYDIINNISRLYNFKVSKGTKVVACMYFNEGNLNDIAITSYKRSHVLITLMAIFVIITILVGGFKGVKSILALIFTLVCVIFLMMPLMIKGVNPILSAILIAIISISITMTLVSGINKKTLAAITGTFIGVIVAGIIAYGFGNWAHLSGITMEDSESIMYIAETTGLKVSGILFAGILVASLGAVMDVAMSISSSIFEIYDVNKKMTLKELFKSGMNIGRDIIGTMTNTLVLAFAGGSITTMILLYSANMWTTQLINLDILGTEVIQSLAGTIGIILTVPITAIISAYLCKTKIKDMKIKKVKA
ncbi:MULTISPECIES: YibE/F family protein [Clostridium]|uniref:YibE/F family protein n=1 Tax=Clostridium TaxID=1485 RepID=UPI00041E4FBB|nr:YibE/F family protein [Clostridium cadaveris]MDU4952682.1 YibE/F family protein [Clostridium sp.]NME63419.1 YibE/F family protein [Clostridium cadaveris]NWK12430.1 YibE/F family protein [Clostridium cadaveris]